MKKKLPLELVKGFNPKYGDEVTFDFGTDDKSIVIFKDKDPESDFYFEIKEISSPGHKILVEFKPANRAIIKSTSSWFTIEQLNAHFDMWIKMIKEYNSSETIFDDPIVKGFEKELLEDIDFTDPDAETKPFPIEIILRLDLHLEKIEMDIEKFKDLENEKEITEIKTLAADLRKELSKKPKKYVFRKLVNIWAKIIKQGPKLIKEFLTEGGKVLAKESIKFLIGKGLDMLG
jgi:hypothetical protein